MKTVIINMLAILLLVAACIGVAYILPVKAAIGIVFLLQFVNIIAVASIVKNRNDDGKA